MSFSSFSLSPFFLGSADVYAGSFYVLVVESINSLRCLLVVLKIDESKTLGLSLLVSHDDGRSDGSPLLE